MTGDATPTLTIFAATGHSVQVRVNGGDPIPATETSTPGRYTVTLQVDGTRLSQPAEIVKTMGWPLGSTPETIRKR